MSYSSTFVGNKLTDYRYAKKNAQITGVCVVLDDDTEVFVGTDTNVLEVKLPVCNSTEEATTYANYILSSLSSYRYQPYEAYGTMLDPAVQLGDGITAKSVYGGVYRKTTTYGRLMRADVSAPYMEEVNSEYPYVNNYERKQNRKYTRLEDHFEASLTIQANEIRAEVSQVQTNLNGVQTSLQGQITTQAGEISAKVSKTSPSGQTSFSWALNDSSHTWYANGSQVMKVNSSGLEVKGKVTATSGYIGSESSGFTITSTAIKNGKTSRLDQSPGIYIGTDGISLGASGTNTLDPMFTVDNSGNCIIKNLFVRGTVSFQTDMSSGAYSYSSGGVYTGAVGGNSYSTNDSGGAGAQYLTALSMRCGTLICSPNYGAYGAAYISNLYVGGVQAVWGTITVGSATYTVLKSGGSGGV